MEASGLHQLPDSSIFQISIALGLICLVVKKKPLWFAEYTD